MPGYADTKKLIEDTLVNRPAGTVIVPEDHQTFALSMLDYIHAVELLGASSLQGAATVDTVPVQPIGSRVSYISSVPPGQTYVYTNFLDEDGHAISVTSGANTVSLLTLLWNGTYWTVSVTPVMLAVGYTNGYLFKGIAVPTDNPGTPDQNVFYIASQTGTYTNFGGLAVADGEVAILRYNGSWAKEITGAATAEKVTRLEAKVDDLDEAVFGTSEESAITLTESYGLIKPDGTFDGTSPSIWSISQDISLNKGDTIKLTAYGTLQAAAISIKSGNTYTMPTGCTWPSASKSQASFEYTATNNCVVVLCYRNNESGTNPRSASVVRLTGGLVDEIQEKVDDIPNADGKIYARERGAWVELNLSSVTDKTLTQSDVAADAKVVGDILNGAEAEANFHTIDIQLVSDVVIDNTGAELESIYYSRTIATKLNAGDTIRLNGAGIASASAIAKVNGNGTFTPLVLYEGASASQQQIDYQATEECEVTLCFRNGPTWTHSFAIKRAATKGLVERVEDLEEEVETKGNNIIVKNIIEVGTGKDFTSLVTAIESITDASKINQYEIHLFAGTYDTVDETLIVEGGDYKGLIIPDYVSIIGIGNRADIIIRGQVSAETAAQFTSATINKISAINMMLNGNLENVTLYAKNVRYGNHNDGTHTTFVKQVFRDVLFIYDTLEITGVAANCNGIGNECGKDILFDHCVFDNRNNNGGGVFMHDNAAASEKHGARLEIRNCIFKGAGIALSNSGGSYECYAILTGNKFVSSMLVTSSNNTITTNRWKVIASSNLDFGYTQSVGMSGLDLSGDITAFCNGTA